MTRLCFGNIEGPDCLLLGFSGVWLLVTDIKECKTGIVYADGYSHDRSLDGLRERLDLAERFVFDPQACAMAAGVAISKPSSILAALAFTKLPFDPMWIEFANADTRKAMADLGSPNLGKASAENHGGAITIERTGFMLSYSGSDVVIEYAHTDRTADGRTFTDIAPVIGRFSLRGVDNPVLPAWPVLPEQDDKPAVAAGRLRKHLELVFGDPAEAAADAEIRGRFISMRHPDVAGVRRNLVQRMGEQTVRNIEHGQSDEMYRLFALQILPGLILLNCRNAVEVERTPAPERLNRQRAKKGRPPIPEYKTVKIHLSAGRRLARDSKGGHRGGPVSGGLVTGHFKVRSSGIYWWSPHWRGGKATTGKTFLVTR